MSEAERRDTPPVAPDRSGDPSPDVPHDDAEHAEHLEERIALTPGLVILGVLAVALGVFAALVMSAHSLSR